MYRPAPGEDHGAEAVSRETHGEGLDGDRVEVEQPGVQLNGAQRAGSDDYLEIAGPDHGTRSLLMKESSRVISLFNHWCLMNVTDPRVHFGAAFCQLLIPGKAQRPKHPSATI